MYDVYPEVPGKFRIVYGVSLNRGYGMFPPWGAAAAPLPTAANDASPPRFASLCASLPCGTQPAPEPHCRCLVSSLPCVTAAGTVACANGVGAIASADVMKG